MSKPVFKILNIKVHSFDKLFTKLVFYCYCQSLPLVKNKHISLLWNLYIKNRNALHYILLINLIGDHFYTLYRPSNCESHLLPQKAKWSTEITESVKSVFQKIEQKSKIYRKWNLFILESIRAKTKLEPFVLSMPRAPQHSP